MKRVLVVYYSQTGQLADYVRSLTAPLAEDPAIEVVFEELRPSPPYPFPWPPSRFFDILPECVRMMPCELEPLRCDVNRAYDLVVLAYPVWFLSPSLPTTAFLKSAAAALLLRGTPVMTVIDSHGVWLMAQEKVKHILSELGARLVDNIALPDQGGTVVSFLTAPRWMLTGRRDRLLGLLPRPGASEETIRGARRFGDLIRKALLSGAIARGQSALRGHGAVDVNRLLIGNEHAGRRVFSVWAHIIGNAGPPGSRRRRTAIVGFVLYLGVALGVLMPVGLLVSLLLYPLIRGHLAREKAYFEAPSGSAAT